MTSPAPRLSTFLFGCALAAGLAHPGDGAAQQFTPIADAYSCARFPDGRQEVVRLTPTGYDVLRTAKVRGIYAHERRIIRGRLRTFDGMLRALENDRIAKGKVLKFANKVLTKVFNDQPIPSTMPESELELAVQRLYVRLEERRNVIDTILKLLDNCAAGVDPNDGKGSVVSPVVEVVVIATSREIWGGFRVITEPLLVQFATEPGGFPACVKTLFPDGFTSTVFRGVGNEHRCGTGTLIFEGVPPLECDKLIPPGKVGVIIQKANYAFLSLPDRTTEELLDQMRLELTPQTPTVTMLAFTTNLSRDRMVEICETF